MKLNEEQKKMAEKIRELYDISNFSGVGTAYTFSEVLALILDGTAKCIHPAQMQRHFTEAWRAYLRLMGDEHKVVLEEVLGEKFEIAQSHPEAGKIMSEILNRISEKYGFITPGMKTDVDIDDILEEL